MFSHVFGIFCVLLIVLCEVMCVCVCLLCFCMLFGMFFLFLGCFCFSHGGACVFQNLFGCPFVFFSHFVGICLACLLVSFPTVCMSV